MAYREELLDQGSAQKELKKLADETGMFDSITDEQIKANTGRTYQDATALRDPLAGISFSQPPADESEDITDE